MTDTKPNVFIYPRLCLAFFCQFAIWGSWAGALGQYMGGVLGLPQGQIGWLYSAIPLGAIIAPLFIGPIADRYFPAQKVAAFLHFVGGLALILCGVLCLAGWASFIPLMILMLISGSCFMPTISLVNSIVFKHLPDAKNAPLVFVFGTFGWIAVNLAIEAFFGGASKPLFFVIGGGIGVFLAGYCLTLPNTPPKEVAPGQKGDALGLGALSLMKDPAFAIFVLCAFFASIPACNFFFPAMTQFLAQRGYPAPVALSTINQFSELFFMAALPLFIAKIGLKRVLLIGMGAWVIRYILFIPAAFSFAVGGLLLHGFCYSFLYVAAYMYADKKAPEHLKASAQSFMVFLLLGVGQVLGGQMYGYLAAQNPPKFTEIAVAATAATDTVTTPATTADPVTELVVETTTIAISSPEGEEMIVADGETLSGPIVADTTSPAPVAAASGKTLPIPAWSVSGGMLQYLDLGAQVDKLLGKTREASGAFDLGKIDIVGNELTFAKIDEMTDTGLYTKSDLKHYLKQVAEWNEGKTLTDADVSVSRETWFAAQAMNWKNIFSAAAGFIAVFFLAFLVLGKDPVEEPKK